VPKTIFSIYTDQESIEGFLRFVEILKINSGRKVTQHEAFARLLEIAESSDEAVDQVGSVFDE
jgi:hypothetical protein